MVALAAPKDTSYVCYKPDDKQENYPWDNPEWWFNTTGSSGDTINRVPTKDDYVFLYSSKNSVNFSNKKPMVVTNGVDAVTGKLEVCDETHGTNFVIGITVQDGGRMTNKGEVWIGNSGDTYTSGGLLTVESGGTWTAEQKFRLGYSAGTSWLNVNAGGSFSCDSEFLVGCGSKGAGIVTNEGTMTVKDLFPGVYGTGIVVNKGSFTINQKLTIARYENSFGHFILDSGATLNKTYASGHPIRIAFGRKSTGIFECRTDFTLDGSDYIIVANGTNSVGRLVIGDGVVVSNAASVRIGEPLNSRGSVELHGGSLWVKGSSTMSEQTIILGSDGDTTKGFIHGWGNVYRQTSTLRIMFFGQAVADGEGVARDLNLAAIKTIGQSKTDNLNGCGTNGWFAVNKGRLIYPRAQNCTENVASHPTVGDYPTRSEPTVMNSFRYTLTTKPNATYYNFAELYATDREDIPAGLPLADGDAVAGVWRFGLSSASGPDIQPTPISFGGMSITFRYDWRDLPDDENQKVVVYRHDGSANGTWQRVSGRKAISSSDNTVTTRTFDASSETWNAGWFAVVAETPRGLVISYK